MKKLLISALLLSLLPATAYSFSYKILAVVNGESVSTAQVKDRVKLVMSSAGMPDNASNRAKVTKEVADILINEVLQKQDGREKKIDLTDAEINAVISDLEKNNKLKPGGFKKFVEQKGISYATLRDQIIASILWKKILQTYVRPGITVTDEDISKAKAQIDSKPKVAAKTYVNISEIIIPIEFGKEQESKDLAETIVRTARGGTEDFGDLAKRYSVGKTAPNKGQAGWLPENGMIEPLASNIKKTGTGKITDPIQAQSMYVILKINERKTDAPPVEKMSPKDKAFANKIEEGAKKYIKALRDKAYIEKKYTDANLVGFVWE